MCAFSDRFFFLIFTGVRNLFVPDFVFDSITDITVDFLKKQNIRALILDVDNTLSNHGSPTPFPGVKEWIDKMQQGDIRLMISSNNFESRVAPFAQSLGLPFLSMSCKPFPMRLSRIKREFNLPSEKIAIVGDQIFTDILGGSLKRFQKILVLPKQLEDGSMFKFKRVLERPFIAKYYKRERSKK